MAPRRVFLESRPEVLWGTLRQHPLATLVTSTSSGVRADMLPLLLDTEGSEHGTLRGHVARANPVWREAEGDALAIFHGPQAYISPSWYPSKGEHQRVVPTWNYVVVEARGPIRWVEDPSWLRGHIEQLTEFHESSRAEPWSVDDAPGDFVAKRIRAVVGFELVIGELLGKAKLGQNRSPADRKGAIEGLRREADPDSLAVAEWMERALEDEGARERS